VSAETTQPPDTAVPAAAEVPDTTRTGGELGELVLSRGEVDRSGLKRTDDAWLAAAWADPGTRVVVVQKGQALIRLTGDGAELAFVRPDQAPDGVRFLLGVAPDGAIFFGVDGPLPDPATLAADGAAANGAAEVRPAPLREAGPLLSNRDAGLMTHAVALANFHDTHHFCPRCGEPSEPVSSGHARRCTVEGTDEFPRVDPAMIVLVTDPADRALLARNAAWPATRVSILAGFVEAGESAEQAVVREVSEEVGLAVGRVRYLGSQPWPMPQSLMLGFRAEAVSDLELRTDDDEITEAHWFSRAELGDAIARGEIRLPAPVSIAHQILRAWYGQDIPSSW
jgi:NADH pyrophosphatase NudC (nudix superfamily)